MILGIGSDIADINRIARLLENHSMRFKDKYFTPIERARAESNDIHEADVLAKRFAAKEACAKALGTGIAKGVYMRDIGVDNNKNGAPSLTLTGGALKKLKSMTPAGYFPRIHLSLSDEPPLAKAIVIIEAISKQDKTALESVSKHKL